MIPKFTLDSRQLKVTLSALKGKSKDARGRVLTIGALAVTSKAQRRAPVRFGFLQNSSIVGAPTGASVEFGFNASYAEIMDQGWKVSVIRPKKAKALFIPLTRRGARQGALSGDLLKLRKSTGGAAAARQASRRFSGRKPSLARRTSASARKRASLPTKNTNRDFIFVLKVVPRKPVKGSRRGPNYYFSGTLTDVTKDGSLGRVLAGAIQKELGT